MVPEMYTEEFQRHTTQLNSENRSYTQQNTPQAPTESNHGRN
jgi:hypothetical protein